MQLAITFVVATLATSATASTLLDPRGHYCFGGCVQCYCGDIQYNEHTCKDCTCDENTYVSTNASNPQGTCDQPDGFHLGCGFKAFGKCI